jgi:hypothetical protein
MMLPAYGMSTGYVIFFCGYEIIGLYFLQNVLLAVFYSNYLNRVEMKVEEFERMRNKFLIKKFKSF